MNGKPLGRERFYPLHDAGVVTGPDYDRVVRSLSDLDLAAELDMALGENGYREALLREHARRSAR